MAALLVLPLFIPQYTNAIFCVWKKKKQKKHSCYVVIKMKNIPVNQLNWAMECECVLSDICMKTASRILYLI